MRTRRVALGFVIVAVLGACAADASSSADSDAPTSTSTPATTTKPTGPSPASDRTTTTETERTPSIPPSRGNAEPDCLDTLTLDRKVALLVWPAVSVDDWDSAIDLVRDTGVGGVLLMRASASERQLTTDIALLDDAAELGVLVATDEEGGAVQRLRDIARLPSQFDMSRLLQPADTEPVIAKHAVLLDRIGVDVVLGPVVDVAPLDRSPALQRSRMFEGDASAVSEYARAYVSGWRSSGLLPTLKHYPGHGSASGDTHVIDGVTPEFRVLEGSDLMPYRALSDLEPAVLVGHLTVPGLTDGAPATASPAAIDYLRQDLGYENSLVISDALDMAAADGPAPEAAANAIGSGIDVVLVTDTSAVTEVIDNIVAAAGSGDVGEQRIDDAASRVLLQLTERGGGCDRAAEPIG